MGSVTQNKGRKKGIRKECELKRENDKKTKKQQQQQ